MVARPGYVSRIPQCILNDSSLPEKSYHLFLAMLHVIDPETNELQMSLPELQAIARMSESTVRRHLRDLIERGYLVMQRPAHGQHVPTTYRLPESILAESPLEREPLSQRQVSEPDESDNSGGSPVQSGTRARRNMLTRIRLIRNRDSKRQVSGCNLSAENAPRQVSGCNLSAENAPRQVSAPDARTCARVCLKALKHVVVFRFKNNNIFKTVFNTNANTRLDSRARACESGVTVTPDTNAVPAPPPAPAPQLAAAPAPLPAPAPQLAAMPAPPPAPAPQPAAAPAPPPAPAPQFAPPAAQATAPVAHQFPPHLRVQGMAPKVMNALLAQYGEARVALAIRAMRHQTTTVQNPAGWVIRGLREAWDFSAALKYADQESSPESAAQIPFESEEERRQWEHNVKVATMLGRGWRDFETGIDTEAFMRKYRPDLLEPAPVKNGRDYTTGPYADIIES